MCYGNNSEMEIKLIKEFVVLFFPNIHLLTTKNETHQIDIIWRNK